MGTPGSSADGSVLVTASARNFPDLTAEASEPALANIICTWPEIRASIAVPLPLYGICTILTPAMELNNSAARCVEPPMAVEA